MANAVQGVTAMDYRHLRLNGHCGPASDGALLRVLAGAVGVRRLSEFESSIDAGEHIGIVYLALSITFEVVPAEPVHTRHAATGSFA